MQAPEHSARGEMRETAQGVFATTHWSVVLAAGQVDTAAAHSALEVLCRTYWFPLYAYVRRRWHQPEEAQDLTQEFFLRLIEKQSVRLANSERGKFRSFLLTSLKNFLINEWEKGRAAKRGGTSFRPVAWDDAESRYLAEPSRDLTPDRLFDKRWAVTIVERAQHRLREEYAAANKLPMFEQLQGHVWGEGAVGYADSAARLNTTEGALRIATHRMKDRFRSLLREEVAHTAASAEEIDAELRYLVSVLRT
jgi:DNA-directed RNA polymerase specialized sigma24 family protein